MFRKILFTSVFSFCLLLPCCYKNTPQVSEEPEELLVSEAEEEITVTETFVKSVVLAPSAGLNLLGRDEKMHRMSSLSRGNVFDLVMTDDVLNKIEISDEDRASEIYYDAVYDSVDYWIFSEYVAPNSEPALVIEKAIVYGMESEESAPVKNLSFSQLIAKSYDEPETENSAFAKIWFYDSTDSKVKCGFVNKEKISTYKDDVEVAAIVEKLRATTRATPRNELFKKAEKLNPSPAMKKILDAEKTEKISYDYQEVLKSMPGARYIVNVEELNTVDQSKDPFKK